MPGRQGDYRLDLIQSEAGTDVGDPGDLGQDNDAYTMCERLTPFDRRTRSNRISFPQVIKGATRADAPPGSGFHQLPVFGIDAQGSAGARCSPSCKSSSEMPSGVRTKAMWPSRGGRLMVTPAAIRRAQVA